MNVFQEIIASIAGVKKYPMFLKNRGGKVFGYVVLVCTIFFLLANVRGIINISLMMGGAEENLRKYVPDFSLKNGVLEIESPVYFDEDDVMVSINTDEDVVFSRSESEWRSAFREYESAMICDSQGMVLKSDGEVQMLEWPEELSFDRETLISWLPLVSVFFVVWFIVSYIAGIAIYFFAALFIALIGLIASSVQDYRLSFGKIYRLSLYAKTLPLLIKGLCRLLGLAQLPGVGTLIGIGGFVLACVYVCLAMGAVDRERKAQLQLQNPYQTSGYF